MPGLLRDKGLIARAKYDPVAMESLMSDAHELVWHIIWRFFRHPDRWVERGITREDLFQTGMLGFLRAVKTFDPARGFEFTSYVFPYVWGSIFRLLRDFGFMLNASRSQKDRAIRIMRVSNEFLEKFGREASDEELARIVGCSVPEVQEAFAIFSLGERFEQKVRGDGSGKKDVSEFGDFLESPSSVEDQVLLKLDVEERCRRLSLRDKRIVAFRLCGFTEVEIAERVGISQAQVSRVLDRFKRGELVVRQSWDVQVAELVKLIKQGHSLTISELNKIWEERGWPEASRSQRYYVRGRAFEVVNGSCSQVEPQVEPLVEPSVEPLVEPSVEPQVEPSVESQIEVHSELQAESQIEPYVVSDSVPASEPQVESQAESSSGVRSRGEGGDGYFLSFDRRMSSDAAARLLVGMSGFVRQLGSNIRLQILIEDIVDE